MDETEKLALENEIREKIAAERRAKQRAYKAKWREKNREHLRQYDRTYRIRKKLCREVSANEDQSSIILRKS